MIWIGLQVPLAARGRIAVAISEASQAVEAASATCTRGGGVGQARADHSTSATIAEIAAEIGLAAVGGVRVAVAPSGVAGPERTHASNAGGAGIGNAADIATAPAVAGVSRDGHAALAAKLLAVRAWGRAGSRVADLVRSAHDATCTAMLRIATCIYADSATQLLGGIERSWTALKAETGALRRIRTARPTLPPRW